MDENNNVNEVITDSKQIEEQSKAVDEKPKKKGKGCLIAILVLIGILVLAFLASMIFGSSTENKGPSWAIYLYVCGSNLEGDTGEASKNLAAFQAPDMPDNLTVVIESGGTPKWHNDQFSADKLQRWTVTKAEGLVERESLPQANMGEKDTFQSFMKFCSEKYPADNTMLIIWDHGGGPVAGACWDDNFPKTKSLQLNEIAESIEATFGKTNENTPLDIVNFDCCLMSSVELAYQLKDCASYLVSSQETIPGGGQNYPEFVSEIKNNPSITPLEFAKTIIDHYEEKYTSDGDETTITLSVVDLSKVENLNNKLNAFAGTLIKDIYSNEYAFRDISLDASKSVTYGGNSRAIGYGNIVDIKDFASKVGGNSKEAQELIQAVDESVVHQYVGYYHEGSGGLSMYYAFKPNDKEFDSMLKQGSSIGFKAYHELNQGKVLSDDVKKFISELGENPEILPNIKTFSSVEKKESYPVQKNSEGYMYVDFGPTIGQCTTNAISTLYCMTEDGTYILGTDDEIDVDWNEGIILSKFGGNWLQIGNWVATAFLAYDSDEYNTYLIPFHFSSDKDKDLYYLIWSYDFQKNEWTELGYIGDSDQPGASRTYSLPEGEKIEIIQQYFDENGEIRSLVVGEEKYSSEDFIRYVKLPDGDYAADIYVEDSHKDTVCSDYFYFSVKDGVITYQD